MGENKQFENENNYFLDETVVQADYVKFYRRYTKIVWACELGLQTKALRSHVILGEPEIPILNQGGNYIEIDFHDWADFFTKITAAFRKDAELRRKISRTINVHLTNYENKIKFAENMWKEKGKLTSEIVGELFKLYAYVDTFAVFNILVPTQYYNDRLSKITDTNLKLSVDDFMVCLIEPHRILVRCNLLKLALEKLNNGYIKQESISYFLDEYMPYAYFDNWLFSDDMIMEPSQLHRNISKIISSYGKNGIQMELDQTIERRREKISKYFSSLNIVEDLTRKQLGKNEATNFTESLAFLSLIASEEEKRHMIECHHFILIGRILKALKMDVARSSVKEIIYAIKMMWD